MPDRSNFKDPERVWNLREFTHEMRKLAPRVVEIMQNMLDHSENLTAIEQMALTNMVFDRAYGRPRVQIAVNDVDDTGRRTVLYIPDNGRGDTLTYRQEDGNGE